MITGAFLSLVFLLLRIIFSPLRLAPDVALPEDLTSAITTAGGYLTSLSAFIPVGSILAVLALVLTIEGALFAYKVIMWLIKRLPTQS